MPTEQGEIEKMVEGKSDLTYTVELEIMPPIELADFKGIKLERLTAEVPDSEVEEALKKHRRAEPSVRAEGRGRQGRERRPRHHRLHRQDRRRGRSRAAPASDVGVGIGSNTFIPGFEEQLIGIGVGETRTVKVYLPAGLSGRESRRQRGRIRRHREVDRSAGAMSQSTTSSPSRSVWSRSTSCEMP